MNQVSIDLLSLVDHALVIAEDARAHDVATHLGEAKCALLSARDDTIHLDLLAGRITVAGTAFDLTPSEFALTAALAVHRRGLSRDALGDLLYPDAEPHRAASAIKVLVYRVRRKSGLAHVIQFENGRYGLDASCVVDALVEESAFRRRPSRRALHADDRAHLEALLYRLRAGRPEYMLEWEWFADVERRFETFAHDIGLALACDALERGDAHRAAALAADLTAEDPADEAAASITIRALAAVREPERAFAEYRRVATALRRELGCAPSAELRAVLEEALRVRATSENRSTSSEHAHSAA